MEMADKDKKPEEKKPDSKADNKILEEMKKRITSLEDNEALEGLQKQMDLVGEYAQALEKRVEILEAEAAKEPTAIGEAPVVEDTETFRYHKTKAPEGKKFKTSELDKLGAGWVDTPAEWKK